MNWTDIVSIAALVAVAGMATAIVITNWRRFAAVVWGTIRHPLKTTEIKFDEQGKVIEFKVLDNSKASEKAAVEKQLPAKD